MSCVLAEKMKDEITCSICRDIFVDPKQLPGCLHTFCNECVMRIFQRNDTLTAECPLCRAPVSDFNSIKSNFHVSSFVRLYHEQVMAEKRDEAARQEKGAHSSNSSSLQTMQNGNQEARNEDSSEDSIFLDQVAGRARKELQQLVEPLHSKHNTVVSALNKLECVKCEYQAKYKADCMQVKDFFSQMRDILNKQEENCLQKLNEIITTSLDALTQQTDDLSDLKAQLDSCKTTLSALIQSKQQSRIIEMETGVKQSTKDLIKTVDLSAQLDPVSVGSTNVSCGDEEDFNTACKSLCYVYSTSHPPNCSIKYVTDHVISVTKPIVVSIVLRDVHNNLVTKQSDHFELQTDHGKDFFDSKLITEVTPGVYDISYYPKIRYAHKLNICHENNLVACVNVPLLAVCDHTMSEQRLINSYGSDNRRFNRPCGLALGPNEEIVISDRGLHRLIVFDPNQQARCVIGYKGHGNGEFNCPSGIAVDSKGCVYVADRKNHCVQKVRLDDGTFVSKIGKKGKGNGEFNEPRAVALTQRGHLFVADGYNHRIQVFQNENFTFSFGQYGTGPCEFNLPVGMAFNGTEDMIFVSDNRNHRVQVFTIHGEYLNMFGDFTHSPCTLNYPHGIHWSKDGHILISCSGHGRILVFKEDGGFVNAIESLVDRPGELATNSQGQLIATNHYGILISECTRMSAPCI